MVLVSDSLMLIFSKKNVHALVHVTKISYMHSVIGVQETYAVYARQRVSTNSLCGRKITLRSPMPFFSP